MRKLQVAFKALDSIIQGLNEPEPQFVGEYLKARVLIYNRGGGRDNNETPGGDAPQQ